MKNNRQTADPKPNSRTLGHAHRKTLPRADLAAWTPDLRKQAPAALLRAAASDRVPALAPLKIKRMACSPFSFFRGAAPVMAYDLSLLPHTGILTQLCGDAHVQNLGAYSGLDGRLIFDINDFDETIQGPFEWDVKRMTTSILLAAHDAGIKKPAAEAAARTFLSTYSALLARLARMPILEAARYQVHRLATISPIAKILSTAERSTPITSLDKLTEQTKQGRRFNSNPPLLRRVTGSEAKSVLASLAPFEQTLHPARRHFLAQYRPLDVALKVVGTGSIGLRDYCVYLEGNGPGDPLFLQIKQESTSAYAPYLPSAAVTHENQGKRAADGQIALQLQSDPLLGWTTIDGRDYLVRQLNDHKASLDITTLKPADLTAYSEVCGELFARSHARSGDAHLLTGYIGRGKRFSEAILHFAKSYADQTVTDWTHLTQQQKDHQQKPKPKKSIPHPR